MNESVAHDILREAQTASQQLGADVPEIIAVQLADEVLSRGGWNANTCRPLIRAYELARDGASS